MWILLNDVQDAPFLLLAQEGEGLLIDGDERHGVGLLGAYIEGIAAVRIDLDIVPGELLDVVDTEAAEAAEESGPLDLRVSAGSLLSSVSTRKANRSKYIRISVWTPLALKPSLEGRDVCLSRQCAEK